MMTARPIEADAEEVIGGCDLQSVDGCRYASCEPSAVRPIIQP